MSSCDILDYETKLGKRPRDMSPECIKVKASKKKKKKQKSKHKKIHSVVEKTQAQKKSSRDSFEDVGISGQGKGRKKKNALLDCSLQTTEIPQAVTANNDCENLMTTTTTTTSSTTNRLLMADSPLTLTPTKQSCERRKSVETPERQAARRERNRLYMQRARSRQFLQMPQKKEINDSFIVHNTSPSSPKGEGSETPEATESRQARQRRRERERRAAETPEQTAARNERNRLAMQRSRQNRISLCSWINTQKLLIGLQIVRSYYLDSIEQDGEHYPLANTSSEQERKES